MKKIAMIIAVAVLGFAPAGVARAELCEKCKGKSYIMSVGKCVVCGGFTGSGAHKLCRKCSAKLGQCEHCRAPLKMAKRQADEKPKPKPATPSSWGPSITRELARWSTGGKCYLDFDTGRLYVEPPRMPNEKARRAWCARTGIDILCDIRNVRLGPVLVGVDIQTVGVEMKKDSTSERWWDIGPTQARNLLSKAERPERPILNPETETSYVFRTREGGIGMLQLLEATGKTLKLRYRLIRQAPVSSYLSVIELDDSHKGKTVSAIVGQQIIIRLKGAPVPGHMWDPAKLKGDAIEQVGQMKFVPDARPQPVFVPDRRHQKPGPVPVPNARPQPVPGRGLVAHTMGGPGKYVFTFRAVKSGKAEVKIKGRVHRDKRPVRTFALTVNVKADPTAERVKKLKANLDKFAMTICYRGRGPKTGRPPRWCRHITLSVPPALVPKTPSWRVRQISKDQAGKIIDQLAKTGFLARATPRSPVKKMGDRYALAVHMREPGPRSPMLMDIIEDIGWGPQLLKRLEGMGLQKVLEGDAAKAFNFLLKPIREKFGKEGKKPAPAKVEKIDTKKSGTYVSGKWKYVYTIRAAGTRSERRFSSLTYGGEQIVGAKTLDRMKTPWGMMQYYQMSYTRGWMLELNRGTPIDPTKGRLLPSPAKAGTSQIAPLELDVSHNGKTVSAVVGQAIVIRLKGNPTTGYDWTVGNIEGDAVGQIGTMKYVSDAPARLGPGGRGRPSMIRVGGGGRFVFTFRTVKAGKSKLTLEYKRGWEKKPPNKTFTLTVNVKKAPTAERVEKLKANLDKKDFELVLRYHGPKGDPAYLSLGLVWSVQQVRALAKKVEVGRAAPGADVGIAAARKPNPNVMRMGNITFVRITEKQAIIKIIDHLADEGFLGKAIDITNVKIDPPGGPIYSMQVNAGKMRLHEYLGWDLPMLKRLDGLRKVLDGNAAKEMDKLLKRLEGQRKEWEKSASVKPQAGKDDRGVTGKRVEWYRLLCVN